MSDVPEIPYRGLLVPELLALIDKSAKQQVAVPTFVTRADIADLLKQQELGDINSGLKQVDNAQMPIDDGLKESLSGSEKEDIGLQGKNSLTIAFALLGYASMLGRKIEVAMTRVDARGQMDFSGRTFQGHINPQIFEDFQTSALEGAKVFFGSAAEQIGSPERMVIMGFLSPNADIDG